MYIYIIIYCKIKAISMYKSSYLIHTDQALVVSNPTSDISESLDLEGRTLEEMLNVTALSKRAATKRAVLERIRDSSVLHFCGHGAVAGILKHKIFTSFLEQYALFFLKKKKLVPLFMSSMYRFMAIFQRRFSTNEKSFSSLTRAILMHRTSFTQW